ncbi:hypothetical protein FC43_GL000411 [Limosilactobacillus ingluviei DSM 15946]|uniref:Uncharacterized protein n=1 Tax=Limosilactobacillus ingluviei DSM 15946 TaxID=1423760 RepID=A0A0R1UBN7_9LACO|nr:hypothetical protein FC43_GL000411 [Limosilactobacillus ingluviei DSM 15946]
MVFNDLHCWCPFFFKSRFSLAQFQALVAKKAKVNRMLNTRVKSSEFYNKVTGSAKKLKNY